MVGPHEVELCLKHGGEVFGAPCVVCARIGGQEKPKPYCSAGHQRFNSECPACRAAWAMRAAQNTSPLESREQVAAEIDDLRRNLHLTKPNGDCTRPGCKPSAPCSSCSQMEQQRVHIAKLMEGLWPTQNRKQTEELRADPRKRGLIDAEDSPIPKARKGYTVPLDESPDLPPPALDKQIGGEHYKNCAIQPVQFIEANKLAFLEGCVVKRVTRHDKPTGKGRQDIEKAIHELQLLLELRYGKA